MNEFFHADIFFFVTTIAVIFVAAGATTVLIYAALIARDVRQITRRFREEGDAFMRNVADLREYVMQQRSKVLPLLTAAAGFAHRMWDSSRSKRGGQSRSRSTSSRKTNGSSSNSSRSRSKGSSSSSGKSSS